MTLEQAADAVELIVADGVDAAMNRFNGRLPRFDCAAGTSGSATTVTGCGSNPVRSLDTGPP